MTSKCRGGPGGWSGWSDKDYRKKAKTAMDDASRTSKKTREKAKKPLEMFKDKEVFVDSDKDRRTGQFFF
jgi:hypothetical protein